MPAILKAYEIRPMLVWGPGKAPEEMLFRLTYKAIVMVTKGKGTACEKAHSQEGAWHGSGIERTLVRICGQWWAWSVMLSVAAW